MSVSSRFNSFPGERSHRRYLFDAIPDAAARGKELLVSIIRQSSLSTVELSLLGNNLDAAARCAAVSRKRTNRRIVRAVNRSLARFGESVRRLHWPVFTAT